MPAVFGICVKIIGLLSLRKSGVFPDKLSVGLKNFNILFSIVGRHLWCHFAGNSAKVALPLQSAKSRMNLTERKALSWQFACICFFRQAERSKHSANLSGPLLFGQTHFLPFVLPMVCWHIACRLLLPGFWGWVRI